MKKEEMLVKKEEGVIEQPPATTNEVAEATEAKDPFKTGRERIASITNFFSRMKEKAVRATSNAGAKLSRFWSRTKSFGGEAAAAVLSADVLAKKGYNYVEGKVAEADKWTGEKAEQAGEYIGKNVAQAKEYVVEKGTQAAEYVGDKAEQFAGFVESNYDRAANFTKEKAGQLKKFAEDKVELAKDFAFLAKEKTVEGFVKARDGVKDRYNQVKTYGENAIMSAKIRFAEVKKRYREKMNDIRMRRVQSSMNKMARNGHVNPEQVQVLQLQINSLIERMGLLQSIETVA